MEKEEKVISEFLKSIGSWRDHLVISGGYALMVYRLYLTDNKEGFPPVGTSDIDTLIPRRVPNKIQKDISDHLIEAGFQHFYKDHGNPASESYVKDMVHPVKQCFCLCK